MASISHLHDETNILPIADSLSLLCSQFLASSLRPRHPSSLRPRHPSYPVVTQTSGPRAMKHTLQSCFFPSVSQHLVDGVLPPDTYTWTISSLHTAAVRQAIASADQNRVLQAPPPPISPTEKPLSRVARTTLSQLRLGHCAALRSYQARIGAAPSSPAPSARLQTTPSSTFSAAPLSPPS